MLEFLFGSRKKRKLVAQELLEEFANGFKCPSTGVWYTQDAPEIEAKKSHLVLLYDNKRPHFPDHDAVKDFIDPVHGYQGRAFTVSDVEAFRSTKTGDAIAFKTRKQTKPVWAGQVGVQAVPLLGALVWVEPKAIFALDRLYGNNIHCRRELMSCVRYTFRTYYSLTHDRTHQTPQKETITQAWVYLGIPEMWDIDAGFNWQPLSIRNAKNKLKIPAYYYLPNSHRQAVLRQN